MIYGKQRPLGPGDKHYVYDLSGDKTEGISVTVEYSAIYGDFISRVDDSEGYWHCSHGISLLPARFAFLKRWVKTFSNPAIASMVQPRFDKI